MPCCMSISVCFRPKSATSEHGRSTTSRAQSKLARARRAVHRRVFWRLRRGAAVAKRVIADGYGLCARGEACPRGAPDGRSIWRGSWIALLASKPIQAERSALRSTGEQIAIDAAIADNGLELIRKGGRVLTHCNTGPLATGGGGTAAGVIIAAQRAGKKPSRLFVDETRPLLQGSRLPTIGSRARREWKR